MDWLKSDEPSNKMEKKNPWNVLVVDDDESVFQVTKLALSHFQFEGRKLNLIYADSGVEAKKVLSTRNDIAVALVDVVMETDDAGLTLVEFIRQDLENHYTRIVLRTGQPGFAPESDIIQNYDIDGYKSKTELSQQSLTHCFYTSLRSYRDLVRIQKFQQGLEALVESLLTMQSLDTFDVLTDSLLMQLRAVLSAYDSELVIKLKDIEGCFVSDHLVKRFCASQQENHEFYSKAIEECLSVKANVSSNDFYAHYNGGNTYESVLLIVGAKNIDKHSKRLINLFSENVCVLLERLLGEQNNA